MKKFWKFLNKHWFKFVLVWLSYVLYSTYTDPVALETAKARMMNPLYYGIFGSLVVFWFAFVIWWRWQTRKKIKNIEEYSKALSKSIAKSVEETKLLRENEIPDDESISKYYKMYLKKFELDHVDQWTTVDPISFEVWEEGAKADKPEGHILPRVRWEFMIAMTSDAFMFDPSTGTSSMMRYHDYEEMI